jgi:hypothetical protein
MMRRQRSLTLVLAGALFAGLILPAAGAQDKKPDPAKDLLGTWDVRADEGGYAFVFKFFLEKDELKGLFTGQSGESKMENLKVEANKLGFVVNVGQGMALTFTLFFGGDEMNGQLSLQYGEASVSGKKRK